jgi:hypothetical protein
MHRRLTLVMVMVAGCHVEATFEGSRYQCRAGGPPCPEGLSCLQGYCRGSVDGADGPPLACGKVHDLIGSDFEGGLGPQDIWNAPDSGCSVAAGQVSCATFADSPGRYDTVRSAFYYDLRDSSQSIEILEVPDPAIGGQAHFVAMSDYQGSDSIGIYCMGGFLHAFHAVEGSYHEDAEVPYDAVADRFWQVREVGGTLHFETSRDGSGWVPFADAPTPAFAAFVAVQLAAGAPDGLATDGGSAVFDNLNGARSPTGQWCPASSFSDDFGSDGRDPGWHALVEGSCTIGETAGGLQVTVAPGAAADCRYFSSAAYDLSGSAFTIEVPQRAAADAMPYLALNKGYTSVEIRIDGANLIFASEGVDLSSIPYDAGQHRWWRVKGEGGQLVVETSPDGRDWTMRDSLSSPIPLTMVRANLGVRTGASGSTSTSTAIFDNFGLPP